MSRTIKDLWPIKPMLAKRAEKPFNSDRFIFELKWDGTRCIAFIEGEMIRLQNRRLRDITSRYPELRFISDFIKAERVILDGEIVVLTGGVPDFKKLQIREQTENPYRIEHLSRLSPALYIAFDVLFIKDRLILEMPLRERKEILGNIVKKGDFIVISESYHKGIALYREAVKRGFEGIIAKEMNSIYQPGIRSEHWLKIKKSLEIDAIVCGWLVSEKRDFSSLILGVYSGNRIVHIGQVGTGFNEEEMKSIMQRLKKLRTDKPVFSIDIPKPDRVRWVKPEMVVRVSALEKTGAGRLRAPVFLSVREDKTPEECDENI